MNHSQVTNYMSQKSYKRSWYSLNRSRNSAPLIELKFYYRAHWTIFWTSWICFTTSLHFPLRKGCTTLHKTENEAIPKQLNMYLINGKMEDYLEKWLPHLNVMDKSFTSLQTKGTWSKGNHWKRGCELGTGSDVIRGG